MDRKYRKITISGGVCTGKSSLFSDLQDKLGWKTFSSSQYFRKLANAQNKSINRAEEQEEAIAKKIDYMVRDILSLDQHCIIEAWMGGIMAQESLDTLKVLLTCDDDIRIKRYAKREGMSLKQAEVEVEQRESHLLAKLEEIHKIDDIFDPSRYNVVIDTTGISKAEVLQEVVSRLNQ